MRGPAPTSSPPRGAALRAGARLPAHYIRHLAEVLRDMGVDARGWLARAGVAEAQLADAALAITSDQLAELVAGAYAITEEPALALLVGDRLGASAHGMLGYASLHSGTVRQALELFERFAPLRMPLLAISHAIERREVRVRFAVSGARGSVARGERAAGAEPAAVDRAILEAAVLSVKNVLEAIARGTCRIHRVAFPFPAPRYAAIARELARCEVRYGQSWAGLALRESQLDVPLRLADAEAFREAARICQRELDQLTAAESYAARVQRLLLERQHGFPALPMAARLLHMTPRTLHRRLVAEGTSYRAILEEVRRSLAVEHLRAGRLGVAEIAHALGYSDLANFRRAFKRWEAVPPSALRPRA